MKLVTNMVRSKGFPNSLVPGTQTHCCIKVKATGILALTHNTRTVNVQYGLSDVNFLHHATGYAFRTSVTTRRPENPENPWLRLK